MAQTVVKTPLYHVINDWYGSHDIEDDYAALIRAFADWLVPEELPLTDDAGPVTRGKWGERTRLRSRLLAEADRAEAGE